MACLVYALSVIATFVVLSNGQVTITPDKDVVFVEVGSPYTLTCQASSINSQLSWEQPWENMLGVNTQSSFKADGQVNKLSIANFTSERSGTYTCKLSSGANVFSDEIKVTAVSEHKVEPVYQSGNSSAVLSCSVELHNEVDPSIATTTWKKGDTLITDLPDKERFSVNANNALVISEPKREDIGTYTVVYTYNSVPLSYSCDASFKAEELQIVPTKVEATYSKDDNDEAILACNIAAGEHTVTKVEWLQNDTLISKLKNSNRFTVLKENNTLIIDTPSRNDAGLYIARFHLEGVDHPYDCTLMYKALPYVVDFKKSKNLIENDKLELQCEVKGYPRAAVTWYKDGEMVNASTGESQRIQLHPLSGYSDARLIIRDVDFEDAGQYECVAYSQYFNSTARKTIEVRVKDKLAALWPFIGIVCEVVVLCLIIFFYERRRNKQAELEEAQAQEAVPAMEKKDGVRQRNTNGNTTVA